MIRHTSYLGQVRLLSRSLGQDDLAIQEEQQVGAWDYATAKRWFDAWEPLISDKTACLRDPYVTRFMEYIAGFLTFYERGEWPEGASVPIRVWMIKAIEKTHECTGMESVAPEDLPKAPAQPDTVSDVVSTPAPSTIPTWAYIAGGVTIAGLLGYLIVNR